MSGRGNSTKKTVTGSDVIDYMDRNGISASEFATTIGCSRQTIYLWRSTKWQDKIIVGAYTNKLLKCLDEDWQIRYREALKAYLGDPSRNVVFWNLMRHAGITDEVYVPAKFHLESAQDGKVSTEIDEVLLDWERSPAKPKLIFGTSGSGKTTFIRHAILRLLEDRTGDLPLLVPLGLFSMVPNIEDASLEEVLTVVCRQLSFEATYVEEMVKAFRNGAAVLFLDGIDEILPAQHENFFRFLQNTLHRCDSVARVIVTSRQLSFLDRGRLPAMCRAYKISSLSDTDIRLFTNTAITERATANAFLSMLTGRPNLKKIAQLPLTLGIMLGMYRSTSQVPLNEAAVFDMLFAFSFGTFSGGRSLGGYVEREHKMFYHDSPMMVQATLYNLAYELRCIPDSSSAVYTEREVKEKLIAYWTAQNVVPETAMENEFRALRDYLIQIGIIEDYSAYGSLVGSEHNITFVSEQFVDWFAASHLLADERKLEKEIEAFAKKPLLVSTNRRRMILFALELIGARSPNLSRVEELLGRILDRMDEEVEKRVHTRLLFLVDCLQRGLVWSYAQKREIRVMFRKLYERNHYSLIQRAIVSRRSVLTPGQEFDSSMELDYVNPFELDIDPATLQEIISKRYEEIPRREEIYKGPQEFSDDIKWRYKPDVNDLLEQLEEVLELRPNVGFKQEIRFRRRIFAAHLLRIDETTPEDVGRVLDKLLEIARKLKNKEHVFMATALDSAWYLIRNVEELTNFIPDHPMTKLSIDRYKKEYFRWARDHSYFRSEYCKKSNWSPDSLLNDDKAKAQFLIVEYIEIIDVLKSHPNPIFLEHCIGTLKDTARNIANEEGAFTQEKSHDLERDRITNKIAKICIYLSVMKGGKNTQLSKSLVSGLVDLADTQGKTPNREQVHALTTGPRQLYDYAIFALWILTNYDDIELNILPF